MSIGRLPACCIAAGGPASGASASTNMAIHSFGRLAIMVPSSRGLILYSNRLPRPGVLSEAQMIMSLLAAAAGALLVLQTPPPPQAPTAHPLVRVFLDCDECDENYLKKEVTF